LLPETHSPLRILGSRVDPLTAESALAQVLGYLHELTPRHVVTGNTLMFLEAEKDDKLRTIIEKAALVLPESWGIHWASRLQGQPLQEYTPGIDFMLRLCALAEAGGHSVYLLGGAPGVTEEAAETLARRFPGLKIVGTGHGYFKPQEEPAVIHRIRQRRPSLLFVGMGMPAQEKWIAANLNALSVPVVMGVGGSFDVLSGRLKRAPSWMRRFGIEWTWRLVQEPWRWRRIAQLPVFAWKVFSERHGKWQMAKGKEQK
jgi:N-acetylglucosaminyldiphosphoundecaprenol N-acetyl-beta-D-mannosaminyltransferase